MRLSPIENLSVVPYISKITLVTLAVLKKHIFYSTCELARCYVPDKQHFPPPAAIFKLKCNSCEEATNIVHSKITCELATKITYAYPVENSRGQLERQLCLCCILAVSPGVLKIVSYRSMVLE